MARLARVTAAPLDLAEHLAAVDDPTCGAVVTFVGRVRDHDPEATGSVVAVEYSAHPDAARLLGELADRAEAAGALVSVSHRVGTLQVGEIALLACVATAHRADAYAVSRGLVEEIKASLPVWKRQVEADGATRWIGA
jgi:molybdopterin synthase catalytic subunit